MIYDATRFMLHHRETAGMETWHLYYECELQHPSSLKGTKLSLKSEDVARAGLSGGIGLGLGTIVRSAHWTVRRACLRTSMAHADVHKHMQAKSHAIIDTGVHAAKLKMRVAGYVRDRVNSRQSVGTSGGECNCT